MISSNSTKAKILITIGPASSSKEKLKELFLQGIDVCRLNFSHGTHAEHLKTIRIINELDQELSSNIAILADLQGPKLRIGKISNQQALLEAGHELKITTREMEGNSECIFLNYPQFPHDVQPGDYVLIDDGKIRLKVLSSNRIDSVITEVINGGIIYPNKGVNLPNTKVSIPSLTSKDLDDAEFALDHNVDWIALSFVRKADDIRELRQFIHSKGKDTAIIAKIEKPEALEQLEEIIEAADGIMIARGDLGVELPFSQVPTVQKRIVQICIEHGKPVIIATQMLESMIQNFRPTRAEANDVANAVTDGADALMLSGETSVGQYPVEAVKSMKEIIEYTEKEALTYHFQSLRKNIHRAFTDELCKSAKSISNELQAKGIICFTSSGYTAYKIACHRPNAPIYVFTQNQSLLRRLNIVWGIRAFYHNFEESTSTTQSMRKAVSRLKAENLVSNGDPIIFLASSPLQEKGKTNTIRVERV